MTNQVDLDGEALARAARAVTQDQREPFEGDVCGSPDQRR